jgi:hypothetical protein
MIRCEKAMTDKEINRDQIAVILEIARGCNNVHYLFDRPQVKLLDLRIVDMRLEILRKFEIITIENVWA